MTRRVTIVLKTMVIIAMFGLLACSEQAPPASQPNVVKKKIVVEPARTDSFEAGVSTAPVGPTSTTEPRIETEAAQPVAPQPAATNPQTSAAIDTASTQAAIASPTEASQQSMPAQATSDLIKESVQMADASYDPKGRIDPFEPLFKEQPNTNVVSNPKDKRQRRIPQTPLEKVALSQLKLSAIIRAASGNRALVADATGKGYVIQTGTYIGLNSGKVIEIERDRVVIEEEMEDLMGELKIQNSELKLQKPAGEF